MKLSFKLHSARSCRVRTGRSDRFNGLRAWRTSHGGRRPCCTPVALCGSLWTKGCGTRTAHGTNIPTYQPIEFLGDHGHNMPSLHPWLAFAGVQLYRQAVGEVRPAALSPACCSKTRKNCRLLLQDSSPKCTHVFTDFIFYIFYTQNVSTKFPNTCISLMNYTRTQSEAQVVRLIFDRTCHPDRCPPHPK